MNPEDFFPDDYLKGRVQVLIDHLNKHVPAVRWPEERFKRTFAQRSPQEILADRDTSFIGNCLDYTPLASHYLRTYIDEDHDFGVQLLLNGNGHNTDLGLHTFLMFSHEDEKHTLDFSDRTNVYLYKGLYENAQPHVRSIDFLLLPPPARTDKNLFENYADDIKRLPIAFDEYLEHVNKANNDPKTYARYLEEIGDQRELTLKPYHPRHAPKPI